MTVVERIRQVCQDPTTSFSLRAYLVTSLSRDPGDVANELEMASHLANLRCVEVLGPERAAHIILRKYAVFQGVSRVGRGSG